MKKIFTMGLLALMLTFSSASVYAGQIVSSSNIGIAPFWDYLERTGNNLNISSGKAKVTASIVADRSITKVSISSTLQQSKNGKWVDLKTWSETRENSSAVLEGTYAVAKGYDYRVVSTYKAYINSTLKEEVTMTTYDEYY